MLVPKEIKTRVESKVLECIKTATKTYGYNFTIPSIKYTKRGTTAGVAELREWAINLNPILLVENVEEFINDTVIHEISHLIDYHLHPENFDGFVRVGGRVRRKKRDVHGATWRSVMTNLGGNPKRCHSFDVTNAKVKKNRTEFHYKCPECGAIMTLGAKQHNLILRGRKYWLKSCSAAGHKGDFVYIGQHKPVAPAPLPKAAQPVEPTRPKAAATGSKIEQCRALFDANKSRKENIRMFISKAGCSEGGASTYYNKLKNE